MYMSSLISSPSFPPPSPPNSVDGVNHFFKLFFSMRPDGQLIRIQLSVLLATIFLFLVFIHGSMRRRIHVAGLNSVMKGLYLLTAVIITYIMGLMHDASFQHRLFPIWALFLIFVYGGVDTMTACELSDNDYTLKYWLHTIPLFFWAAYLAAFFRVEPAFAIPFCVFYFLASMNTKDTLKAFYVASKSKGLPELTKPVVDYMQNGDDVPNEDEADPLSMRGYRYLVWGDPPNGVITTTEKIWNSERSLLCVYGSTLGSNDHRIRSERLKDLCLSFALFRLLLRRFSGFPLHESSKMKTKKFVQIGLLSMDDTAKVERVFRIIEVELNFVFDLFYTKFYVLGMTKTYYKLIRLGSLIFCLWFAFVTLNQHNPKSEYLSIKYRGHSVEVGITRVVIMIVAMLEIWQISIVILSNWKLVKLVCEYVEKPDEMKRKTKKKKIQFIWRIREYVNRSKVLHFFVKPWQRKLGQYSFMKSCCKVPIGRTISKIISILVNHRKLVKVPRVGQTGEYSVTLSMEVKRAIVKSLTDNGLTLSRGKATLQKNELSDDLSYACELETDAHVILVWHIATCVCECYSTSKVKDTDYFPVATQLSKYCAYLITFAPELLSGHPYTTECLFDDTVKEALQIFKGKNMDEQYKIMMNMSEDFDDKILVKAAILAKKLMDRVIDDQSKGWRVLAEFWAELLLYMAPSDDATAHGEHLSHGGEFITHLWALLTHAGIVSRDSSTTTV